MSDKVYLLFRTESAGGWFPTRYLHGVYGSESAAQDAVTQILLTTRLGPEDVKIEEQKVIAKRDHEAFNLAHDQALYEFEGETNVEKVEDWIMRDTAYHSFEKGFQKGWDARE